METQEISEAQELRKLTNPRLKKPRLKNHKKVKHPKRVAAGKKNAEVRKSKQTQVQQAKQAQQAQAEHEPIRITKESPERPPTVNVYKNFIPLCVLIGAVGVRIFMICGRKTEIQPKNAA